MLFDDAGLSHPSVEWTSQRWNWETYVSDMSGLTRDIDGDGNLMSLAQPVSRNVRRSKHGRDVRRHTI